VDPYPSLTLYGLNFDPDVFDVSLMIPADQVPFVDFEHTPLLPAAPSGGTVEEDITAPGLATFKGGTVASNLNHFPAISYATAPNVYWTASQDNSGADPSFQPAIEIDADPRLTVSEISFPLFNGEPFPVSYTVDAFSGSTLLGSQTMANVAANATSGRAVVDIKEPNITALTIAPSGAISSEWDFIIDSVTFNSSVQQAVPIRSATPHIVGVAFSGSGANTVLTIDGSGFGNAPSQVPFTGNLANFLLVDGGSGTSAPFEAGSTNFGSNSNVVTLNYQSWSDNQIVISGFSGAYGQSGYTMHPGDLLHFTVWNSTATSASSANDVWTGAIPVIAPTPPEPQNSLSLSLFPNESQLWTQQAGLNQVLFADPNEQSFVESQSKPLASANAFLAQSGWKSTFVDASTALGFIGTGAGFAGALTDPDPTELETTLSLYLLQQTPEYQTDIAYQQSVDEAGILSNVQSLLEDGLISAGTSGFDPISDFGTFTSAIGLVADSLSFAAGVAANDPPDPNYQTVFVPGSIVTAPLNSQGVSQDFSAALTGAADALDATEVDLNAVGITANRYGSALAANDATSAGFQYLTFLQYLGDYNSDAAEASLNVSRLARITQSEGIGTQQPTAASLAQVQSDLQTQGASIPGLYQYFETMGFTDTQIRTMVQQATTIAPTLPTESIDQALGDLSNELLIASAPVHPSQDIAATLLGSVPASAVAGVPVRLRERLTVKANSAINGTFNSTVLLSPDESAADNVLTLGSVGGKLPLIEGRTRLYNIRLPRSIPADVEAGTYRILIQVTDTEGVVSTFDSGQTLNVLAPVVDLTGSFANIPASVKAGRRTRFTFLVTNSSAANVAAIGAVNYSVGLSPDGQAADSVSFVTSVAHVILRPGQSRRIAVVATLTSSSFLNTTVQFQGKIFSNDVNPGNNVFATAAAIQVLP
jgi:hypothetical protein